MPQRARNVTRFSQANIAAGTSQNGMTQLKKQEIASWRRFGIRCNEQPCTTSTAHPCERSALDWNQSTYKFVFSIDL